MKKTLWEKTPKGKAYQRAYRSAHREKLSAQQRVRYLAHREEIKANYRSKHPLVGKFWTYMKHWTHIKNNKVFEGCEWCLKLFEIV